MFLLYSRFTFLDFFLLKIIETEIELFMVPVVPPPGAVSADITPGKRADRKSKPYLKL